MTKVIEILVDDEDAAKGTAELLEVVERMNEDGHRLKVANIEDVGVIPY